MCTTAALHMCVAVLRQEDMDNPGHIVRTVMHKASKSHGQFLGRVPIMSNLLEKTLPIDGVCVDVEEYVICEEFGCKELKDGKPTSYLISKIMLAPCLKSRTAILTCEGHSVCVWREDGLYGMFDSFPSRMTTEMTLGEFDEVVGCFITGQCDVTLLSRQ
jgi:hypothetical protein